MQVADMVTCCLNLLNAEEAAEEKPQPVRKLDRAHLRWALRFLGSDPEVTPGTFFTKLDQLAMGVPYRRSQWEAACRGE